jgi:hypothetical protein
MNTKLASDISMAANTKLASILDYLKPALVGGGVLTGAAAVPALLNSYVNEENPLKTLASVAQYTLPMGMALGAGTVPISKIENLLKYMGSKIPSMDSITSAISSRPEISEMSDLVKLIGSEVAESGRDFAGLLR